MLLVAAALVAPAGRLASAQTTDGEPPANDAFAAALDLSPLTIVPDGPEAAGIDGTLAGATTEPGEAPEVAASVWYRYTSSGFAGRLGYRVTADVNVATYTDCASAPPGPGCEARGGSAPPYVRMEPGYTVWFQVWSSDPTGSSFTLSLFEAANPARSIATAPSPVVAPGGNGPFDTPTSIVGDTFGPAGPDGPTRAMTWATFVLGSAYAPTFSLWVETASGSSCSTCALFRVTLHRAPTVARVADPDQLSVIISQYVVNPDEWNHGQLPDGRYYVSIEQLVDSPAFFTLNLLLPPSWEADEDPPEVVISSPPANAAFSYLESPQLASSCTDAVDPSPVVTVLVDGQPVQFELPTAPGVHVIEVRCTDRSGNTGVATTEYTMDAGYSLSFSGPSSATAGTPATVEVVITHAGGAGPVRGFDVGVESGFTADLELLTGPPGVVCTPVFSKRVTCTSTADLAPGASVRLPFRVTAPAGGAHAPCSVPGPDGPDVWPFSVEDRAGPVCVNVTAQRLLFGPAGEPLPADGDRVLSVPLVAPYLRFDTTLADTPAGSPVALVVRPRNPGTGTLANFGFIIEPKYPFAPDAHLATEPPPGWTCASGPGRVAGSPPVELAPGGVFCHAETVTLGPGQVGEPIVLRYRTPPTPPLPGCAWWWPAPEPDPGQVPCTGFSFGWTSGPSDYILVQTKAFRILPAAPSGPCLLVETTDVAFGAVQVGTSAEAPVRVHNCGDAPLRLAASVSDAARPGGDVWTVATDPDPPAGSFTLTASPAGGAPSGPLGPQPATVGDVLAGGGARTDTYRIRLGPTGPGLGTPFDATITFTATVP